MLQRCVAQKNRRYELYLKNFVIVWILIVVRQFFWGGGGGGGGLSLLHSSIAANTLQDSGQGIVNRVKVFAIYIFDV